MGMLPKSNPEAQKGQVDHVDAWLMSYADLITLLFMFFVIFVSFTTAQTSQSTSLARGEPEHPYIEKHNDVLTLDTPFESTYRNLTGIIIANNADQAIAVGKTSHGLWIDISVPTFFETGSADIREAELPVLKSIADTLKNMPAGSTIEVAAYTDDDAPQNTKFANNWELSAMQAARVVNLLTQQGVDPAQLRATSFANNHPVVANNDVLGRPIAENRMRNQRVVINVERNPQREMSLSSL
jgi:chemotaxis protein MotB